MSDMKELKRIWMFAFGSRGDVQPYVAIGHAAWKHGYEITFFCNGPSYSSFAESYGCKAVALGDCDFDTHMRNSPLMMKAMMNGDIMTSFRGLKQEFEEQVPVYCQVFLKELESQGPPDLCLVMPLSNYFGWYLAVHYHVPLLTLATSAAIYNSEHPPFGTPKLPFGLSYYLFYNIICGAIFDGKRSFDKCLDSNVLQSFKRSTFISYIKKPPLPVLLLTSPEIAHILAGDPEKLTTSPYRLIGTTVMKEELQLGHIHFYGGKEGLDNLKAFLKKGEKPIYLGWGSMICKSQEFMVKLCAEAVYRSGYRAVVLGGFAQLSMELLESIDLEPCVLNFARNNILFVQQAPHEWLFPKVKVIVHHGGAGTTASALRAGIPTIITPVFADQWDYSYFLRKTGVGIGFNKQLHRIGSVELGDAIQKAAEDPEIKKKAFALGEKLRREDGAERAVIEIEEYWREYCITGKFYDIFPGKHETGLIYRSWFWFALAIVGTISALVIASSLAESSG